MKTARALFVIQVILIGITLIFQGCGPSARDASLEAQKLKILSLEDVKGWNAEVTRKEVQNLVSSEAVLMAASREVMFKAKEGGAYSVSFYREDGKRPYTVASVIYIPKYPDESSYQVIFRREPLPNLPVNKNK